MAAKKFKYQFEDIRRGTTPVTAAGFGDLGEDLENPDEALIEIDLDEEDPEKAVSAVQDTSTKENGEDAGAAPADDKRREAIRRRREQKAVADEAVGAARNEVAEELNTLHGKIDSLQAEKDLTKVDEDYETKKADIEAKMVAAMEAGESEKYAKLNSSLIELNTTAQEKRMEAKTPHQPDAPRDLDGASPGGAQPANPRAVAFIKANQDWWVDPDQEDAVDYIKRLDKKLVDLGHNPQSDRYWKILHNNFDKKFPELRNTNVDDLDDDLEIDLDTGSAGGGSKSPVSRPGAGGGASKSTRKRADNAGGEKKGGNKVRLTAADKQNMARFLLDPENPEHCRQYALNKVPEEERA